MLYATLNKCSKRYPYLSNFFRFVRLASSLTIPYMTIDNGTVLFVDPTVPNLEIRITCLLIKGMKNSGVLGVNSEPLSCFSDHSRRGPGAWPRHHELILSLWSDSRYSLHIMMT